MLNRRLFLKQGLCLSGLLASKNLMANHYSNTGWFMPDETDTHLRTWMAFGANKNIWGKKLLPVVQKNLADIANTISKYEPVNMLVGDSDYAIANKLCNDTVNLMPCGLDDLWIRDTGPVFVINDNGEKAGINFNFNDWGEKQDYELDSKVANFVTKQAGVNSHNTDIVLEGGGIEVDGHGTAIITESCVINENRNPSWNKAECEDEIKYQLGLEKIIWLPGVAGEDITDGHTDFYARFIKPGVVVAHYEPDPYFSDHKLTKEHLRLLRKATDANGNKLEVISIEPPAQVRPEYENNEFTAGYINFYVCNNAVILPEFGDRKADNKAKEILARLFTGRTIEQLNIDGIAAGGGGIHCATQQEPLV